MDEQTINGLRRYELLPKRFQGSRLVIEFQTPKDIRRASADLCDALGLEIGATICAWVELKGVDHFTLFASNEVAEQLLQLAPGIEITARVRTLFGIASRIEWSEDGPITTKEELTGLLVEAVVDSRNGAAT
jgi:hypothetical protein